MNNTSPKGEGISYNATALSEKLSINMNNWNYDETNDIYYQIGLVYCANPKDTSGGGAQSAIMGASDNSELYNAYLESIGAAMVGKDGNSLSNSITGAMCWCPITNLDTADEAYEWNIDQYAQEEGSFKASLSDDLAVEYATYINNLNLKDQNGNTLTLEESESGIYTSGSYYDYMLSITEESLNNFLNDTTFPYTPSNNGEISEIQLISTQNSEMPSGEAPNDSENMSSGNMQPDSTQNRDSSTYETAQDYIDSLNGNDTWIEYDESTNTAKITSLKDFVSHCKNPSKSTPAFDDLERSQAENGLFGLEANSSAHFDKIVCDLLNNNSNKYSTFDDYSASNTSKYSNDLAKKIV